MLSVCCCGRIHHVCGRFNTKIPTNPDFDFYTNEIKSLRDQKSQLVYNNSCLDQKIQLGKDAFKRHRQMKKQVKRFREEQKAGAAPSPES